MVHRGLPVVIASLLALLVGAPVAGARACSFSSPAAFPGIADLRAYGVPCSDARGVADGIQASWGRTQSLPRSVKVGRRTFRCRYQERQGQENPYMYANCRRISDRKRRVVMDLVS